MIIRQFVAAGSVALVLSAAMPAVAIAHSEQVGPLSITDLWTRATPPGARTAGGFLVIENSGTEADRLTGATSPAAARVEIHEMRMEGGTMIMRPAPDGIDIPAGGTVTLAPGGLHIMFMDLKESFTEGDKVSVTLDFEKAGEVETFLHVMGLGARSADHGEADEHGHGR
jgi:periplasmic copper chaperone A